MRSVTPMSEPTRTRIRNNTPVLTVRRDAPEPAFRRAGRGRDMLGIEVEVVRRRANRDVKPENGPGGGR